jgi:hypothetical protein
MRAAVLALGEVALARAAPADRGGVGAHPLYRANPLRCRPRFGLGACGS